MTETSHNAQRRGTFITFEGGDGAGKSTHIRYVAEELRRAGREVVCLREPGGTEVGEALRSVVLDPEHAELSDRAELLIYEAARAQLVSEVIEPALARGAVVLCDRFTDSTVAYQAFGRGLSRGFVEKANAFATGGIVPDRTVLLVSPDTRTGLKRATGRTGADRLEQAGEEFHSRVNRAFLKIARQNPDRIRVVRSARSRRVTACAVARALQDVLPELSERAAEMPARKPAAPGGAPNAADPSRGKRAHKGRRPRGRRPAHHSGEPGRAAASDAGEAAHA